MTAPACKALLALRQALSQARGAARCADTRGLVLDSLPVIVCMLIIHTSGCCGRACVTQSRRLVSSSPCPPDKDGEATAMPWRLPSQFHFRRLPTVGAMEGAKRKAGIDAFFAPVAKKPPTGQPVGQSDAVLASPAPAAGLAQPPVADDGLTVRVLSSRVLSVMYRSRAWSQAEQRRRASVNKALALAKAAHLRACAAADGARAEGRPPRLVELLVGDDWASALQSALQAPSFKSLEAVCLCFAARLGRPNH